MRRAWRRTWTTRRRCCWTPRVAATLGNNVVEGLRGAVSRSAKLDGAAGVRHTQREDRVRRAQPGERAEGWRRLARAWARDHGVDVERVLDTLDEIASTYLYAGDGWDDAQARAWADVVDMLGTKVGARDAA